MFFLRFLFPTAFSKLCNFFDKVIKSALLYRAQIEAFFIGPSRNGKAFYFLLKFDFIKKNWKNL